MAEARALRRRNPKHQTRAVMAVAPALYSARPEEAGAESVDGDGQGEEGRRQSRGGRALFTDRVCWKFLQHGACSRGRKCFFSHDLA
eukprot:9442649-Alexandrium_andersonii.AAC.1